MVKSGIRARMIIAVVAKLIQKYEPHYYGLYIPEGPPYGGPQFRYRKNICILSSQSNCNARRTIYVVTELVDVNALDRGDFHSSNQKARLSAGLNSDTDNTSVSNNLNLTRKLNGAYEIVIRVRYVNALAVENCDLLKTEGPRKARASKRVQTSAGTPTISISFNTVEKAGQTECQTL
jgi:hypothetical protein